MIEVAQRVQFKVNCSGSWANLAPATPENYDTIKAACLMISIASGVKFKAVNASDETIMECRSRKPGGRPEWSGCL